MRTHLLSLVSMSILAVAADAGTVLETVTKDIAAGGRESVSTTYAQDGRVRIENRIGDGVMIFKDDAIYNINDKDRTYTVLDREGMRKLADQINPALKQLQEQLAKMPPEQRAQMERMMSGKMPGFDAGGTQEVNKTTRTGKVGGYACTYVEILKEGERTDEMCVVPTGSLTGGKDLVDAMAKMSALVQEMLKHIEAPWLRDSIARQVRDFEEIGGFPVLTRHYSEGKAVSESTLKSLRSAAAPAGAFDVPAGYTRKEMMPSR